MPEHNILTISDAVTLSRVIDLATMNERITWTPDDGETILYGTVRSIGTGDFGLWVGDVRDGYIRVTGKTGTEHAVPVQTVMDWFRTGSIRVGW